MQETAHAAVVTGASTGIGRAISKSLAAAGWRVFGSVRKEKDAHEAAADVGGLFTPLIFDVTDDSGDVVATVEKQLYIRKARSKSERAAAKEDLKQAA